MRKLFILSIVSLGVFISCSKDEGQSLNANINEWIYANMDYWYLWTADMPDKPFTDQDPADFYDELLVSNDRFSVIVDDYEGLINGLNGAGVDSGFEFKLYLESNNNIRMQVSYIKNDGPVSDLDLKRGDVIYEINGVQMTESNYIDLIGEMNTTYTASYRRYDEQSEEFVNQTPLQIVPEFFAENPILMDSVYELGGKKIGYMVYNFFTEGPTEQSSQYHIEMDALFGEFKSQGVEEFILDLRYNGGGTLVTAVNLASLIVDGNSAGDLMYRRAFNNKVHNDIVTDPRLGLDFLEIEFEEKADNIGSQLTNDRVYILATDRTASASEMVINSLRPYLDVVIIGETTVGKDVGSIPIGNEEDPNNNWGLLPIVVKFVNSQGDDYPSGFSPNVMIEDNFEVLTPLGDINEPLLSGALGHIGVLAARNDQPGSDGQRPIFQSIDTKPTSGRLIVEPISIKD